MPKAGTHLGKKRLCDRRCDRRVSPAQGGHPDACISRRARCWRQSTHRELYYTYAGRLRATWTSLAVCVPEQAPVRLSLAHRAHSLLRRSTHSPSWPRLMSLARALPSGRAPLRTRAHNRLHALCVASSRPANTLEPHIFRTQLQHTHAADGVRPSRPFRPSRLTALIRGRIQRKRPTSRRHQDPGTQLLHASHA